LNPGVVGALIAAECRHEPSATVYRDVHRVEAAQALTLGANGVEASAQAEIRARPRSGMAIDELAHEVREGLRRATARAIDGAKRVAIMVSGGLDSSSVLAAAVAAARGAGQPEIDALNLSFGGVGDDRPYFRDLCEDLGIVPVVISPAEASTNVLRGLVADGAPFTWPTSGWEITMLQRARERGATVMLTGAGGDHIFHGDARTFARELWSRHFYRAAFRIARFKTYTRTSTARRIFSYGVSPPLLRIAPSLQHMRRRVSSRRLWPWAGPVLRDVLRDVYVRAQPSDGWLDPTSNTTFNQMMRSEFLEMAECRGQMEAITDCARVDPLLDDELVELVAGCPQEALLHGNQGRGLFRQAIRGLVPERLRLRRDKGHFAVALYGMIRGSDLSSLRDLASARELVKLGLVEPGGLRKDFDAALGSGERENHWLAVWPAIAAEAFVRKFQGEPGSG
jgi:asparagine synthase (glutamine-hydrolysing)